jgi:hypothetical protein
MRQELERAREETEGSSVYALATYYFVTGNYSLMVVLVGVLMTLFGGLIVSGRFAVGPLGALQHDVFAGMFGVWGATLVLIGATFYGIMWANKIYARISQDSEDEREETTSEPEFDTSL